MTEKALFHYTNGFTGDVGDGSAPYTEAEFYGYNNAILASGKTDGGVLGGVDNELEVSVTVVPPDTIQVATGRAQIGGIHYFNTGIVSPAIPFVPAVGDTGGIVIIRDNFTAANNPPTTSRARARVLMSADGTAAIPAIIQTAGTTYDLQLASFVVDTNGTIYTDASKGTPGVTDLRRFFIGANAGMIRLREFDGDGVTASVVWSGIQQDLSHLMIVGQGRSITAPLQVVAAAQLNGIGVNYASTIYKRTGGAVASEVATASGLALCWITGAAGAANAFDSFTAHIQNYTQSTGFHSCRSTGLSYEGGTAANYARVDAVGWYTGVAAPITSISIVGATFATGSKLTLYGLK